MIIYRIEGRDHGHGPWAKYCAECSYAFRDAGARLPISSFYIEGKHGFASIRLLVKYFWHDARVTLAENGFVLRVYNAEPLWEGYDQIIFPVDAMPLATYELWKGCP